MKPEVGKVYRLNEPDYRYGTGPLAVRVTKVLREATYEDGAWWEVECVARPPTYEGPGQERFLYVRASALDDSQGAKKPAPPSR